MDRPTPGSRRLRPRRAIRPCGARRWLAAVAGPFRGRGAGGTYTVRAPCRRGLAAGGFTVERGRVRPQARAPGGAAGREPVGAPARPPRPPSWGAGDSRGVPGPGAARPGRGAPGLRTATAPAPERPATPRPWVTPSLDAGLGPPRRCSPEASAGRRRCTRPRLARSSPEVAVAAGDAGPATPAASSATRRLPVSNQARLRRLTSMSWQSVGSPQPTLCDRERTWSSNPRRCCRPGWARSSGDRWPALEAGWQGAWRLLGVAGDVLAEADLVFLAARSGQTDLAPALALARRSAGPGGSRDRCSRRPPRPLAATPSRPEAASFSAHPRSR